MAGKKFGSSLLTGNSNTLLFTGRSQYDTTVTVIFCNQNSTDARIFLGYNDEVVNCCQVENDKWMIYNYLLPANNFFELKGIVVEQNKSLIIKSTIANVSVTAYGFEEKQ